MQTLIFGGAFDPPHNEHVNMVRAAVAELGISRVVIVPTYLPPHKSAGYLDFDERAELCHAAFCDCGAEVVIDDTERQRGKDNYASLLLPVFKEKYGDIVYLIGGDSLQYLYDWRNPRDIMATCPIAVAGREGYRNVEETKREVEEKFGGKIILLNYCGKDVSSGRIKARLFMGEMPEEIPAEVAEIIKNKNLFGKYGQIVGKVAEFEDKELFAHTRAAVLRAVDLNSAHNLKQDFDKVFLAALLHDNAKQRPSLDGLNVPSDSVGTPVLHQFLGAEKAKRDFGVTDDDILNAIRYHTTAKPDMTVLEKLIYTADSTSYDREYDPIPELRRIVDENFENGFYVLLKWTYDKIIAKGKGIYPLTAEAMHYYENKREEAQKEYK